MPRKTTPAPADPAPEAGAAPEASEGGSDAPSVGAVVARNIRARRTERGMTVAELAERSGVSRRMLTLIEQGQANPSLGTVERIGRAIGADFADLVGARTGAAHHVSTPRTMVTLWTSPEGGYGRMAVTGSGLHRTELWDWLLMPGDRYEAVEDPFGTEELVLVAEGVLVLDFAGGARQALAAGEAARFPSDQRYAYLNTSDAPVRFARNTLPAPLPTS
ncbi:helix-turn-helix domain-containing protein [Yinghuangia seranimata]|uniref:helix-turn-helix domain-containing protein n=1 Tax=Yinghuangia seranimata TaxID=408067 RepID=UPI00248AC585|nr:XRE family transcriptional regulator [Yinghuangia seranimata]MDI2131497.1 XRE family transcriptional regulator [Yinghuangia seranimata]